MRRSDETPLVTRRRGFMGRTISEPRPSAGTRSHHSGTDGGPGSDCGGLFNDDPEGLSTCRSTSPALKRPLHAATRKPATRPTVRTTTSARSAASISCHSMLPHRLIAQEIVQSSALSLMRMVALGNQAAPYLGGDLPKLSITGPKLIQNGAGNIPRDLIRLQLFPVFSQVLA